jgi:hypothetical protein
VEAVLLNRSAGGRSPGNRGKYRRFAKIGRHSASLDHGFPGVFDRLAAFRPSWEQDTIRGVTGSGVVQTGPARSQAPSTFAGFQLPSADDQADRDARGRASRSHASREAPHVVGARRTLSKSMSTRKSRNTIWPCLCSPTRRGGLTKARRGLTCAWRRANVGTPLSVPLAPWRNVVTPRRSLQRISFGRAGNPIARRARRFAFLGADRAPWNRRAGSG